MKRALILVPLSALSGCIYWAKDGTTQTDFAIARGSCAAQSSAAAPPAVEDVQLTAGYYQPSQTTCSGFGYQATCTTTGGNYVPPIIISVDHNASARGAIFEGCMYSQGWHKEQHNPFTGTVKVVQ
jgi:hypothetical protein